MPQLGWTYSIVPMGYIQAFGPLSPRRPGRTGSFWANFITCVVAHARNVASVCEFFVTSSSFFSIPLGLIWSAWMLFRTVLYRVIYHSAKTLNENKFKIIKRSLWVMNYDPSLTKKTIQSRNCTWKVPFHCLYIHIQIVGHYSSGKHQPFLCTSYSPA